MGNKNHLGEHYIAIWKDKIKDREPVYSRRGICQTPYWSHSLSFKHNPLPLHSEVTTEDL